MRVLDSQEGVKKGLKPVAPKSAGPGPNGKKNSKLLDVEDALKSGPKTLEDGPGPEVSVTRTIRSSLQRDLIRAEQALCELKYYLGVMRGHNVSTGGGFTLLQRKRYLASLTPPERYLEMTKQAPKPQTECGEGSPIGDGILLASSALQAALNNGESSSSSTSSFSSSSSSSYSSSRARMKSEVLYSTGTSKHLIIYAHEG